MIINHNMQAMNAHRQLWGISQSSSKTMERLSSGLRINRAADDAAGLAISETMRNAIRGMKQASRNSQDAISLLQTAEGSLGQAQAILGRMKELAIQASNDTYTANDRIELQKEVDALKGEIQRVANSCNFNGKNLLDGSSAALASSDKGDTRVIVRGSIRNADGTTAAGDYKITVDSTPGEAQIQKSSIFKNSHAGDTVQHLYLDETQGFTHLSAADIADGNYRVSTNAGLVNNAVTAVVTQFWASTGSAAVTLGAVSNITSATVNASTVFEVTDVTGNVATIKCTTYAISQDGSYQMSGGVAKQVVYYGTAITSNNYGSTAFRLASGLTVSLNCSNQNLKVGDKAVMTFRASGSVMASNDFVTVRMSNNTTVLQSGVVQWAFNKNALNGQTDEFYFFSLDTDGTVNEGHIDIAVNVLASATAGGTTFTFGEGQGEVCSLDTALEDIDRFYDPNGRFLVENPQTITLVQGDGKQASFTIFGTDTLKMISDKINDAIGNGLGQADLVPATAASKFCAFVTKADTTLDSSQSMEGGFVIRSARAGEDGVIRIVADESITNALGFADAVEAEDSQFTVTIADALDSTKIYAENLEIAGNQISAVIHPNVDIKFDSLADMTTAFNTGTKTFNISTDGTASYSTIVHLVDNTQVFQIGGSEGQSMGAAIGDMRLESLGLDNVMITDIDSAVKAVAKLDTALTRVSTQRASLGAIQNRLEYNIANLDAARENLQASESAIRDADMAGEMMEFARLNILNQSTMAMLAQANQQPQQVLQLLGR